ncbi:hypothetical protein JT063_07345 [Helicobacter pylori]|nr:hypothetical protein [Helicobacter pylori]
MFRKFYSLKSYRPTTKLFSLIVKNAFSVLDFYSLFFILYSLFFILYSLFFILYSLFFILYSLFFILYSLFFILYSLFFILYSSAGGCFLFLLFLTFLVGVVMGFVFEWFYVFLDF